MEFRDSICRYLPKQPLGCLQLFLESSFEMNDHVYDCRDCEYGGYDENHGLCFWHVLEKLNDEDRSLGLDSRNLQMCSGKLHFWRDGSGRLIHRCYSLSY